MVSGEFFESEASPRSFGSRSRSLGAGLLFKGDDDVELWFGVGKDKVSGFISSVASEVAPKGGVETCWPLKYLQKHLFLFSSAYFVEITF